MRKKKKKKKKFQGTSDIIIWQFCDRFPAPLVSTHMKVALRTQRTGQDKNCKPVFEFTTYFQPEAILLINLAASSLQIM
jgi:hypothetical protein